MKFKVAKVVVPRQSRNGVIAYVDFSLRLESDEDEVQLVNEWKDDTDEWQSVEVGRVAGVNALVRFKGAALRQSKRGELYVQVRGVKLDWALACEIGLVADGMIPLPGEKSGEGAA